jgi:hypothetical protein
MNCTAPSEFARQPPGGYATAVATPPPPFLRGNGSESRSFLRSVVLASIYVAESVSTFCAKTRATLKSWQNTSALAGMCMLKSTKL